MNYLTKHDPFNDIFDIFAPLSHLAAPTRVQSHLTDVRRVLTTNELTISVDLPGVKKEDVEISFEPHGLLKVSSKRADLQSESTHRCSISNEWDYDSADASLVDGVLTLRFKKSERAKPKKLLLK